MNQILIDTNVLVYVFDRVNEKNQARSVEILRSLEAAHLGYLSVQNLNEFFNVVTRKLNPPLTAREARQHVDGFINTYKIIPLTANIVAEALRGVSEHKFQIYDAQLWATAKLNQIPILLSEDFQDGAVVEGVRFLNPFKAGFDLDKWLL